MDHLFLHCIVARCLWMLALNLFGVHWVFPSSAHDLLSGWWIKKGSKEAKMIWRMAPHAIFLVYLEREKS